MGGEIERFTGITRAQQDQFIAQIRQCQTADDVKGALDQIQTARKLAKDVEQYRHLAKSFIELEARALVEIARLPERTWAGMHWRTRDTVSRLSKMKRAEQEEILRIAIEDCCSIGSIFSSRDKLFAYRKAVEEETEKREKQKTDIASIRDTATKQLKSYGGIKLDDYMCNALAGSGMSSLEHDAIKNRVKDSLLKAGGVSVGDGRYVDAKSASTSDKFRALEIRAKSIIADIHRFASIYADAKADLDRLCEEANSPNPKRAAAARIEFTANGYDEIFNECANNWLRVELPGGQFFNLIDVIEALITTD